MEPSIAISTINDFLFCPRSLYMHLAAGDISSSNYQSQYQVNGKSAHEAIDTGSYSSKKDILKAINICSEELNIHGKIDIFDKKTGDLIERKAKIKEIYPGYYMQLYAEYYCLIEMGYLPKNLYFYSMADNKKYLVSLPTETDKKSLEAVLSEIRDFNMVKLMAHKCKNCDNNIYSPLCW